MGLHVAQDDAHALQLSVFPDLLQSGQITLLHAAGPHDVQRNVGQPGDDARIRQSLTTAWQTTEAPPHKPSVADEVELRILPLHRDAQVWLAEDAASRRAGGGEQLLALEKVQLEVSEVQDFVSSDGVGSASRA